MHFICKTIVCKLIGLTKPDLLSKVNKKIVKDTDYL